MQGILGEAVDRIGGEPISARMARKAPIRHLDPMLLLITLILTIYGVVMIFSASASKLEVAGQDPASYMTRQAAFAVVGALILVGISMFDYRHFRGFAPLIYGAMVVALVLVLTPLGSVRNATSGWFDFGLFDIQPAELAKVITIVGVAAYLAERGGEMVTRDLLVVLALVAVPMGLIFLQPDLGTALVFVAVALGLLLVGGAKIRHFMALGLLGVVALLGIFQANLVQEYQIQRLTSFLDPNPDVRSEGYNLTQSKIAIGSGGMKGKGLRSPDTQTSLAFVPEQQTDFIFTAVGEQLGFVGSATLLGLFALLIWRALRIAAMARDMFGMLLATGIAALWAFQMFLNMGMTMGIMPITGVPLPFMSYGGSSLIANFVAVGLLLNIHMRRFLRS